MLFRSTGLESVASVGGDLGIVENDALIDVTALSGVTSVGGDLTITDNTALAAADAEALGDAIGEKNVRGDVTIEDNGP